MKWFLAVLLTTMVACPAFAGGSDVGNGGDSYAADFVRYGYSALNLLKANPIPEVSTDLLERTLKSTEVLSQDQVILDGVERDAVNYPAQHRIIVSRSRWDALSEVEYRRIFLVLHEYLFVMGIDDSNYVISSKLDSGSVCTRSYGIRIGLEYLFKKPCYEISVADLEAQTWHTFREGLFDGLPRSLKRGDFKHLKQIDTLEIRDIQATSLPDDVFEGLDSLSSLTLRFKNVVNIGKPFRGLKNLRSLSLEFQSGQALRKADFEGLEQLKHLSLNIMVSFGTNPAGAAHKKLGLERDLFAAIPDLSTLNLGGDLAGDLSGLFSPLRRIEYVNFEVRNINPLWFKGMNAPLKQLSVRYVGEVSGHELDYLNPSSSTLSLIFWNYRVLLGSDILRPMDRKGVEVWLYGTDIGGESPKQLEEKYRSIKFHFNESH